MKYADISGLSEKDLSKKAKETREQMFQARMKNALGQLTNPMVIREMRRDVARMNTALAAKLRGSAAAPTAAPKATKTAKAAGGKTKAGSKG